ncbi:MAG: hypothetical protein E7Z90_05060 [Cyanobacteria bacterium SIG29]|nr:hypothetical protein [Cyanobacteria bacterium SIG29]
MNINSNISAKFTSTPAFGKDFSVEDAENIARLSGELNDSFETNNVNDDEKAKKKSAGQFLASIGGAIATAFVLGKCGASKILTAFPKLAGKITNFIRKGANFVRNFADDVVNGVKLKKGGKFTKSAAKKIANLEKKAREIYINKRNKSSAEEVIKNAVGVAAMATVVPQVATVDGNNDGVSDLAQKEISAYQSFLQKSAIIEGITDTFA